MNEMILFEDKDIIVCEKPAGIPVQSARIGTADMVSMLKNYLKETEKMSGEPYVGLVHRLDQPVQGILVFAKNKNAAGTLSAQIAAGQMHKQYLAVVCGKPLAGEIHLVDYLQKDGKTNTSKIVNAGTKTAKKAELYYRVLMQTGERALVEVKLITGRHHQIRVQLAGAGIPIEGDQKYNKNLTNGSAGLALAASRLSFFHPKTKKEMTFEIEPKGVNFDNLRKA